MDGNGAPSPSDVVRQIAHNLEKQCEYDAYKEERTAAARERSEQLREIADAHARKLEAQALALTEGAEGAKDFQMDITLREQIARAQQGDNADTTKRTVVLDKLFVEVLEETHQFHQQLVAMSQGSKLSLYFKPANEPDLEDDSDDEEIRASAFHSLRRATPLSVVQSQ